MAALLSRLRERGPHLWGVRLLLGISLLTLVLAGVWQGEFHSHDSATAGHTHVDDDHDTVGTGSQSGDVDPDPLHFHLHDAAASVVMLGPPAYENGWPTVSETWGPEHPVARASPVALNTPHRPPIA